MSRRRCMTGVVAAALVLACSEERAANRAGVQAPPASAPPSSKIVAGSTEPGVQASVGSLSFMVDGQAKRFDYLPDSDNHYLPLASTIKAYAAAGATAALTINFLSIDLRKIEYPSELPKPKNLGQPMDPMAAMATVGFIYVDEDGREWAGPGKIRVESFAADGTLAGTFDGVEIPHVDEALPPVQLTAGRIEARLSRP